MKSTLSFVAAVVSTALLAAPAWSQEKIKMPAPSPAASVSQVVMNTKISIAYSAPGVKGREIWGKLVPYGEVWRLGANAATTIEFSDDVKIGGKNVPAGKYALFAIPGKDKWTFIVNKNADQWGAGQYKDSEDVVRVDAQVEAAPPIEYLNIGIQLVNPSTAHVVVRWEKVQAKFAVSADVEALAAQIRDSVAKAKSDDWGAYMNAAQFLFENKLDAKEASAMIDKSIQIKETWRNLMLKGDMLAAGKKNAEAVATYEKALERAKEDDSTKNFRAMLTEEFQKKIRAVQ